MPKAVVILLRLNAQNGPVSQGVVLLRFSFGLIPPQGEHVVKQLCDRIMGENGGSDRMKTTSYSRLGALLFSVLVLALVLGLLVPAITKVKPRAERRRCVENLKQLALAWSIYLDSYSNVVPASVLSLSNAIANPKLLVCPSDKSRVSVDSWTELFVSGSSYKSGVLGNEGMPLDQAPNHVLVRCTIHDNVALADGSVHMVTPRFMTNLIWQPMTNSK